MHLACVAQKPPSTLNTATSPISKTDPGGTSLIRNSFSFGGANSCGDSYGRLTILTRNRLSGATEPLVEPELAEFCFIAGDERAFIELGAEVACVRVGDHLTRIVARAKDPLDESVEIEGFGPADFNGAIQGSACRNLCDCTRDIVSGDRLDQDGRHANGVPVGGGVGDGRTNSKN